MAWWNRLFKKKEPIQQEEDWEQLVYTRNGVNFVRKTRENATL